MKIIPSINCADRGCVEKKLDVIKLIQADWIHVDIGEKGFSKISTWDNPEEFKKLFSELHEKGTRFEVHVMAKNTLERAVKWIGAGADRIIVHPELVDISALSAIVHEKEIGLAVGPGVPAENILKYEKYASFIEVLAVDPGPSGQIFKEETIQKIKFLRGRFPSATIEVDGGVTPTVISKIQKAGADIAVSGAYIFESQDHGLSYLELEKA